MKKVIVFVFGFFLTGISQATIIHVPQDQPTIQAGINAANNGDTVLLDIGTYVENIGFSGKNIVVGSLFLTIGDTSYISMTVIDGDSSGSVVTFENEEDSTAPLSGFTITNGYYSFGGQGGGIYCSSSNLCLVNVTVTGNQAFSGGGIYCWGSSPSFENVTVVENEATWEVRLKKHQGVQTTINLGS